MMRRLFLFLPAGFWGWRMHVLAKMRCRRGMTLYLVIRGEIYELAEAERRFVEAVVEEMAEFTRTYENS